MLKALKEKLRSLAFFSKLCYSYGYDLLRFFRFSSRSGRKLTETQIIARLFQKAHSIEKGLAMPDVRPGFGRVAWSELKSLMAQAQAAGINPRHPALAMTESCIVSYVQFHQKLDFRLPNDLEWLNQEFARLETSTQESTVILERDALKNSARGDFRDLVAARHSFRVFGEGEVDAQLIKGAVELAGHSPSVCNRQSAKTYVVRNKKLIERCLEIQGGSRGFGSGIDTLLIVTGSLEAFRGARERYQLWIDGGLFAMNLLNGLAYMGLAACPLNWSAEVSQDKKLRRIISLGSSETVIMMIGVGNLRDVSKVARSPRRELNEVCISID